MAFWKIKTGRINGERGVLEYIGEIGHLFYSQDDNVIRIGDGHTLGGIPLSGGSMTFSSPTPPNNPQEGNLWYDSIGGRLYIWYDNSWVDASPENNVAQAITSTGTTQASDYTLDLSVASFVHWQPTADGSRTITLTGFTPGRKVEVFITPHAVADVFTVSGVTASQCSNGVNTFTMQGVGASAQSSFMLQIYCTTSDISGVWIYGNGSL